MKNQISYIIAVIIILNVKYIYAQPATENIFAATDFIINQFDVNDIVAIGETHDKVEVTDFYIQLVEKDEFRNQVDFIVLEMGNHLFQSTLNDYINGKEVEEKDLFKLWRDHTSCQINGSDNTGMIRLLKAIREINQNSDKKVQVLVGDPPVDWTKITCAQQFYKYLGNRRPFYTSIVIDHIVNKKKKALIIMGNSHFNKLRTKSMIENNSQNPITSLVQLKKVKLCLINIIAQSSFPYQKLSSVKNGSVISTKDVWLGDLKLSVPFIKDKELKYQTNGILYLGENKKFTLEKITEFNDIEYIRELERRNNLKKCN